MRDSHFKVALVALIALVSLCTARTIVTVQKCSTRYCGYPVAKVYRTTKTVHATGRYTVTRWKTINKPKYTKTTTGVRTTTAQSTSTIHTVTIETTVWIGTSTHTRKFTVTSPTYTETGPATTVTSTPPTKTIPTPSGFVPVDDDPDNAAHKKGLQKRTAEPEPISIPEPEQMLDYMPEPMAKREPEPVPANGQTHATAVTCTKTLLTKTGTSDLWKTTTKLTGTTTKTVAWSTVTSWLNPTTVTAKNAVTKRLTISQYKVAFASSTTTIYTGATTYVTTVTTVLPIPTYYAACSSRNQGPPEWQQNLYNSWDTGPYADEAVAVIYSNGTVYDCCVECQKYNVGGNVCIGSTYNYLGEWGDPGPGCWDDTEQPGCEPFIPENSSRCTLVIAPNKPASCRQHRYEYEWYTIDPPNYVSNGPHCRRFKYRLPGQPL